MYIFVLIIFIGAPKSRGQGPPWDPPKSRVLTQNQDFATLLVKFCESYSYDKKVVTVPPRREKILVVPLGTEYIWHSYKW